MTQKKGDGSRDLMIAIGTDFSPTPGGRYRAHGPKSGEEFREDILRPALNTCDHVTVLLDGTAGYAGSFLEEAFGGLIRLGYFTLGQLRQKLTVSVENPRYEIYRKMAENYLADAASMKKTA